MHMVKDMVEVDRLAGFESSSVVLHAELNSAYSLVTASDFDVVLSNRGHKWDSWHWAMLCHLLLHADIFVLFFDTRFAASSRPTRTAFALSVLAFFGIRLVAVPSGLDVVYVDGRTTRFRFLERLQHDYPHWDLLKDGMQMREGVRAICRVADFVVSGDSVCSRFLAREDIRFKYFPAPTKLRVRPGSEPLGRPRVVHAPNHRSIKGTSFLVSASERLKALGIDFELELVEKVDRPRALERYADADIIADQFCIGAFGVFALEGMALGKPVLAYLDEEHLGDPVFNLPIVNTTPGNIERVLAILLSVPKLRERLGHAGRAAIEQYQSPAALAEVWKRIYTHVWNGRSLDLATTTHFSPTRTPRAFTEDPSVAVFWPVPVEDLMPDIVRALEIVA